MHVLRTVELERGRIVVPIGCGISAVWVVGRSVDGLQAEKLWELVLGWWQLKAAIGGKLVLVTRIDSI